MERPHDSCRRTLSCSGSRLLFFPLALALAACATTSTAFPDVDPSLIAAEQQTQRRLVVLENFRQQTRLDSVAYPIFRLGLPLCPGRSGPQMGFRFTNIDVFGEPWRSAASDALGLGDTLVVTSVTPASPARRAGLLPGDRLLGANDVPAPVGRGAVRRFGRRLAEQFETGDTVWLQVGRVGTVTETPIVPEEVCAFDAAVLRTFEMNALADGQAIYVTSGMMRFADDTELAAIVAHEFAHNALGHLDAMRRNMALGGILGLIGDLATLLAGDTLPDRSYSSYYAELGARAFSQDFEREADYVGMYALALADLPVDGALRIWREMAHQDPDAIDLARTHPTSAERFVLMQQAMAEIAAKRATGRALRPERRP